VAMSHLHFDHAGGLLRADGSRAFPRATIVAQRAEWEVALGDNPRLVASYVQPELALVRDWGAEGWAKNASESDAMARDLYADRYLSLRYDHLLAQPPVEMHRVWAFLGADPNLAGLPQALEAELARNPDADWQRQKAGRLVEPLEKGKQGSWRQLFTSRDREIFKSIAGQTLIDWGFEQNLTW